MVKISKKILNLGFWLIWRLYRFLGGEILTDPKKITRLKKLLMRLGMLTKNLKQKKSISPRLRYSQQEFHEFGKDKKRDRIEER